MSWLIPDAFIAGLSRLPDFPDAMPAALPPALVPAITALSAITYAGAATAVFSHGTVTPLSLLQPQTSQEWIALLGLGVATASLGVNAWLRWAALSVARDQLEHSRAMAWRERRRAMGLVVDAPSQFNEPGQPASGPDASGLPNDPP